MVDKQFDFTKLRLRKILGLKLDKIASEIGISQSYLCRLENGYIKDIKNYTKRLRLFSYIGWLENQCKIRGISPKMAKTVLKAQNE